MRTLTRRHFLGAGLGAAGGAVAAHQGIEGKHRNEAIGAGIGAVGGALICGGLAYLMTEDPKPKPVPPPPPPPPPPAKPKPAPPPPPPPPPPAKPKPAPKVERTIILDDVLFDFDRSTVKPEAAAISMMAESECALWVANCG